MVGMLSVYTALNYRVMPPVQTSMYICKALEPVHMYICKALEPVRMHRSFCQTLVRKRGSIDESASLDAGAPMERQKQ